MSLSYIVLLYNTCTSAVFICNKMMMFVTLFHCIYRFTGPGGVSNMAIVDVKMVTGWVPVKDSVKKVGSVVMI